MPLIEIKTLIDSDIKICFDLSRNIDLHKQSLRHSNEKAVAGKTSGLIELGESVTWGSKTLLGYSKTHFKNHRV